MARKRILCTLDNIKALFWRARYRSENERVIFQQMHGVDDSDELVMVFVVVFCVGFIAGAMVGLWG